MDPSSSVVEIKVHPRRGDNPGGAPPTSPLGNRTASPTPTERTAHPVPVHPTAQPFKRWFPWLVPSFVVANFALFIITMYVNNCPKHSLGGKCVGNFLGRFSFQPLKENPLFGPSSST